MAGVCVHRGGIRRQRRMQRRIGKTLLGFMLCFLMTAPVVRAEGIQFSENLPDAVAAAQKSAKPVAVFYHAPWCPHCRTMFRKTFTDAKVAKAGRNFEWVAVDIDRNASLVHTYAIEAIPQIQIIDPSGYLRAAIIGATGPADLAGRLEAVEAMLNRQPTADDTTRTESFTAGEATEIVTSPDSFRARNICYANVGYGPLNVPSQSPLQALRLGLTPAAPSTLAKGQKELKARATWVNIWADEADYFFDYEMLQTQVGLDYGLAETFQVGFGFETRSRFGGSMDSFIQEFHDLFNIDQNGRDEVPKGDFRFDIDPVGNQPGVSLTSSDRGLYSSSAQLKFQHNVTCGTEYWPAFAYTLVAQYEIDSEDLEGGNPWDFALFLSASQRFWDFYLYGGLGYTRFGRDRFRGIELEEDQYSGNIALEWRAFTRASIIAQYLYSQGLAVDLGELSDASHEVNLGFKWEFSEGVVLEFALIENFITTNNSPDFGVHAGVAWRFD